MLLIRCQKLWKLSNVANVNFRFVSNLQINSTTVICVSATKMEFMFRRRYLSTRVAEAHVSPRVTTIMVNWVIFRATLGSFARTGCATRRGTGPRKPDAALKKNRGGEVGEVQGQEENDLPISYYPANRKKRKKTYSNLTSVRWRINELLTS